MPIRTILDLLRCSFGAFLRPILWPGLVLGGLEWSWMVLTSLIKLSNINLVSHGYRDFYLKQFCLNPAWLNRELPKRGPIFLQSNQSETLRTWRIGKHVSFLLAQGFEQSAKFSCSHLWTRYSAKGLLLVYQYFVQRHGYTNEEVTIVNKFSRNLNDEDKEIVESLYKIDVLIYSVDPVFRSLLKEPWRNFNSNGSTEF